MFELKLKDEDKKKLKKIGMIAMYAVAFAAVIFGGVKYLVIFIIFFLGFMVGRYFERVMAAIRDWRLLQKVNKVQMTEIEFVKLREENDNLKKVLMNMSAPGAGVRKNDATPGSRGGISDLDLLKYGYAGMDDI